MSQSESSDHGDSCWFRGEAWGLGQGVLQSLHPRKDQKDRIRTWSGVLDWSMCQGTAFPCSHCKGTFQISRNQACSSILVCGAFYLVTKLSHREMKKQLTLETTGIFSTEGEKAIIATCLDFSPSPSPGNFLESPSLPRS